MATRGARYLERFIHGEIYARRPDVQAIVHSHSPAVVPFAASSVQLRPICHMSGFLGAGAPVFEIRALFGMTDMLVRDNAKARRSPRPRARRGSRSRLLPGARCGMRGPLRAPLTAPGHRGLRGLAWPKAARLAATVGEAAAGR